MCDACLTHLILLDLITLIIFVTKIPHLEASWFLHCGCLLLSTIKYPELYGYLWYSIMDITSEISKFEYYSGNCLPRLIFIMVLCSPYR
jgi:hypothetical protein